MGEELRPDVLVIGGGPAGLSCALVLGRCRRKVAVFDDGRPRNARARGVHGFLTRDGMSPHVLRWAAREQLAPFDVTLHDEHVVDVRACTSEGGFELVLESGGLVRGKKLVLATGMRDDMPSLEGLEARLGVSVHTCPYCDGWEHRDEPLASYASAGGAEAALGLTTWSRDVVLFTDGAPAPSGDDGARLAAAGIPVRTERIVDLLGDAPRLSGVRLASGEVVARAAMFLHCPKHQRAPFAERLGLRIGEDHEVDVEDLERSGVPGLWVVGDASRDVQFAIVAAAEGARAAYAINQELRRETGENRSSGPGTRK